MPLPPTPDGPAQTLTVNEDNVLAAGRVITAAVDKAYADLNRLQYGLVVESPADDKISSTAATTWNRNLLTNDDSHYRRLREYIDNVAALSVQLQEAARQYGYTDEEIAASFKTTQKQA